MLSVGIVSTGGLGYYMESVGSGLDDYYARTGPGRWTGAGAAQLGLIGNVEAGQVNLLGAGRHPRSGEELGTRPGKVTAFDLTFSAPKSVSLLAELPDPATRAQVAAAHRAAVEATLRLVETEGVLVGRRGHGGLRQVPTTGAVAAAFEHRTSRAGDPQLHTHLLVFNRARGVDGRWAGIDGRRLFAWAKTAGYVYQAALRAELTKRLEVQWRPVHHGTAELVGPTDAQLREFSTRRAQIEAALERAGATSAHSAQVATLATRPAKAEPVDADRQREQWRARAAAVGLDADRPAELGAEPGPQSVPTGSPDELAARLAGPHGLTEHRSSFDRRDVIRAVAEAAGAGDTPDRLAAHADRLLEHPGFTPTGTSSRHAGPLYSTVELIRIEKELLARAGRPTTGPVAVCPDRIIDAVIAARPTLSAEQQHMVRALCGSGDATAVVIGRAGTGKTFALDACRQAWADAGHPVTGAALAARTAAGLQAGTGIPSTTVDALLADIDRPGPAGGLPHRGVLVIDEAGMVGTRKLGHLLAAAERSRTRVVLVGDPRQLPEVEAGGAFAALAARQPIELTVNRRQEQAWERAALDDLRHGDVARAVTVYRDRQRITLTTDAETARDRLVGDWWAARAELGADRVAMMALHQADVDDLNARARHLRRAAGELAGPQVETGGGRVFAVGDEVLALRNDRRLGLHNGTRATVVSLDPLTRHLEARTADDRTITIPAGYLDDGHLTHGYAVTAHKAQGLTTGRAFVLGSDRLYREAGYTALSRATQRTDLYQVQAAPPAWQPAPTPDGDLTRVLSRSAAQSLASHPAPDAQAVTDRTGLRDAALADPGPHLLDRLGPPPPAGPGRDAWAAAAVAIDTYRQRHHHHGPDAIGDRPADPAAHRDWAHAQAAADQLDRLLSVEPDRHLTL